MAGLPELASIQQTPRPDQIYLRGQMIDPFKLRRYRIAHGGISLLIRAGTLDSTVALLGWMTAPHPCRARINAPWSATLEIHLRPSSDAQLES
jgi:hypothetical protein